ncbi:hypothetical protein XELAEV_18020511mg [Xenopus laevis]|uniref:Uncharacterized protein n=1 Tax=Xenopus laevis TaxID=8355 RepID=A0A974HR44_XENLA|nr:hypothetical protein XELAEV_18020511mg [Xenopus laevis]
MFMMFIYYYLWLQIIQLTLFSLPYTQIVAQFGDLVYPIMINDQITWVHLWTHTAVSQWDFPNCHWEIPVSVFLIKSHLLASQRDRLIWDFAYLFPRGDYSVSLIPSIISMLHTTCPQLFQVLNSKLLMANDKQFPRI